MSIQSQKNNMADIAILLDRGLGYIYGTREGGPNGDKKMFLDKSAQFLRALAKDLHFVESRVTKNPAGIAVSGDVGLYEMWSEGNGVYLNITEPLAPFDALLYRQIVNLKDYTGGANQWLPLAVFRARAYETLVDILLAQRKKAGDLRHAA